MKRSLLTSALAAAALCGWLCQAQSDKPTPDALRDRAGKLEQKASDLKAAGRHDEAMRLMNEVNELNQQAKRIEKGGEPMRPRVRAQELKQQHARLTEEIKELRANGKDAEARELEQKRNRLERELDSLRADAMQSPQPRRSEGPGTPPAQADLPRRLEHLQVAIDNLHAAGFHEIADRLAQEMDNLKRQAASGPGGRPVMEEVRKLRAEVQELRQVVKELERRMGEFHGPPRDRSDQPR